MKTLLNIGGLVAVGFSGRCLLVLSHSGSGLYEVGSWTKLARDYEPNYPENGLAKGIGPIDNQVIEVRELDYDTGSLEAHTPDKRFRLHYAEGMLEIQEVAQ